MSLLRRTGALWVALLLALVASRSAAPAFADSGVQVHIRNSAVDTAGNVTLTVQASGSAIQSNLPASAFTLTAGGKQVNTFGVVPLSVSHAQQVSVVLLFDISGSTTGAPHAAAQSGAEAFVNALPAGTSIALITIGNTANLVANFTADKGQMTNAIGGLPAGGETALYDGIVMAANALGPQPGQHNIVLFTDGADTVSKATLANATDSAKSVKAPITTVSLVTPDTKPDILNTFATATGGSVVDASDSSKLASGFAQVAQSIASQYIVTFSLAGTGNTAAGDLDLTALVKAGTNSGSDTITILSPGVAAASPASQPYAPVIVPNPVPFFGSSAGLVAGGIAAFVALAVLLYMVAYRPRNRGLIAIRRGLRVSARAAGDPAGGARVPTGPDVAGLASTISKRAVELVEQVPKPEGFDDRLVRKLEQAGWSIRANEFIVVQLVCAVVALLLGVGLIGNVIISLLIAIVAFFVPRLVLQQRVENRAAEFLSQLPDTLQLLSASLKAGAGLLQAIDTVIKEIPPPMATEFGRVLTEARLGLPLEDALEAMATRVGGEDFRWVVMAINIQRQVGGNLALVLETVAATLREREMLRRQVKVLSAEGRLSGVILFIIPIALSLYMYLVNRTYIGTLFTSWVGEALVLLAAILMIVGGLWMRKLVRIKI